MDQRPAPSSSSNANQPATQQRGSLPRRVRIGRWINAILLLLFLLLFPFIIATYHDCAICGMKQTQWRVVGTGWFLSARNQPTSCSDWYRTHVEPQHQHVWVRRTSAGGFDLFGWQVGTWQSGRLASGQFSWLPLGPHTQKQIYQKCPHPAQARTLFLKIARFDKSTATTINHQDELFTRLNTWIESGLQGPWPFEEADLRLSLSRSPFRK